MIKQILILLSSCILIGCSTTKVTEQVVTSTKTMLIEIPDTLLKPCDVTEPYNKTEFIQKSNQVKEGILTDLTISLYGDLKKCNYQIQAIKEYQNEMNDKLKK